MPWDKIAGIFALLMFLLFLVATLIDESTQ